MDIKTISEALAAASPEQMAMFSEFQGKLEAMRAELVDTHVDDLPEASSIFVSALLTYSLILLSAGMKKEEIISLVDQMIDGLALVQTAGLNVNARQELGSA